MTHLTVIIGWSPPKAHLLSNENIFFQSFFMLMTVQPCFVASS
jgi:hypothetical protein